MVEPEREPEPEPEPEPVRGGRPRAFDADAVVAAAMELFWRDGYGQVSIPRLCEATGLATSSIYNSFGSKHALYLAALDRYGALARTHALQPLLAGERGVADVELFLDRLAEQLAPGDGPSGCLITKAVAEFADALPDVASRTVTYRGELREALTIALQRAADLGQLPADHVAPRATALFGLVIAANLLAGAAGTGDEVAEMIAAARDLVRTAG